MRDFFRVLFDESHNSAWSISPGVAASINPIDPGDASYAAAAAALRRGGNVVRSHVEGELTDAVLRDLDVLVLAHPSLPDRERTSRIGSPLLSSAEIDAVERFVRAGGGLIVLGECEQDRYGNNLNELLARFGVQIATTTVHEAARRHNGVPSWVLATLHHGGAGPDVLAGVDDACFYRAGTIDLAPTAKAEVFARSSDTAHPAQAALAAAVAVDAGRVAVFADSDLFGDTCIDEFDHRALWTNIVGWSAGTGATDAAALAATSTSPTAQRHPAWAALTDGVTRLREVQSADGSIDAESHDHRDARTLIIDVTAAIRSLAPLFPHETAYLTAVITDLAAWADSGFGVPDFLDSLLLFRPDQHRVDGLESLAVFPMSTQNGNPDRNLEAVLFRVFWPPWLAELETVAYSNPKFIPVNFVDYTPGYDTHSAVLFPETVAVREVPEFQWGAIFCDREAARFRAVTTEAARVLSLSLPPDAARLIGNQQLAQSSFALWDLIHDRTHSRGDLPFDPFMIKQRMPYWVYALEELRCDLNTFCEAVSLEAQGVPYGRFVQYAILFDRLFRFPITGERVRNYDGLGGQMLFAYLHRNEVLRWTDNRLTIDWKRAPAAVADLHALVEKLYHDGIDRSRVGQWAAAYELVAGLVAPHPGSTWVKGISSFPADAPAKALVDAVLPDEFPLNVFYESLRKKLGSVIAATSGIMA